MTKLRNFSETWTSRTRRLKISRTKMVISGWESRKEKISYLPFVTWVTKIICNFWVTYSLIKILSNDSWLCGIVGVLSFPAKNACLFWFQKTPQSLALARQSYQRSFSVPLWGEPLAFLALLKKIRLFSPSTHQENNIGTRRDCRVKASTRSRQLKKTCPADHIIAKPLRNWRFWLDLRIVFLSE